MESQGVLGVSRGSQDVRQDVRGSQVVKGQRLGGRGDQGVHLPLKGS